MRSSGKTLARHGGTVGDGRGEDEKEEVGWKGGGRRLENVTEAVAKYQTTGKDTDPNLI